MRFSIKYDSLVARKTTKVSLFLAMAWIIATGISFCKFGAQISMLIAVLVFIACLIVLYAVAKDVEQPFFSKRGISIVLGLSFLLTLLVEGLFVFVAVRDHMISMPAVSKTRMLILFCGFVAILLVCWSTFRKWSLFRTAAKRCIPGVLIVLFCCLFICGSFGLLNHFDSSASTASTRLYSLLITLFVSVLGAGILGSKGLAKPQWVYLLFACSLGLFLSVNLPAVTAISPDDQIHYDRALTLSFLGDTYFSSGDSLMVAVPWVHLGVVDFDSLSSWISECNALGAECRQDGSWIQGAMFTSPVSDSVLSNCSSIAYIPSAFGLFLARLFCLSVSTGVILGRTCNLLMYVTIFTIAAYTAPRYKTIFCLVGLLPTGLYLAANFSYDPWVTQWLALGFALVLKYSFGSRVEFNYSNLCVVLLVFVIGLCGKAVYFPVLLIVFVLVYILRSKQLNSCLGYRAITPLVTIAVIVIVLSFVAPLLFPAAGASDGDMRGGTGVSSSGQIAYILANPFDYFVTLAKFCLAYLSPVASDAYTVNYTYMGYPVYYYKWLSAVPFVLLLVFSLYGQREASCQKTSVMVVQLALTVICLISVALVATALYLSFTPVGYGWINGCQPRYLMPLIVPMLICICLGREDAGHWVPALILFFGLSIIADYSCIVNWDWSQAAIDSVTQILII